MYRPIIALLLSYGVFLMGTGLFTTLLGIRSNLEGFSTQVIGLIMSGYFVGLFVGARYTIKIVVISGHIRAFGVFASLMSTTALLHVMWVDPYIWVILRVLAGFCMAGLVLVSESWLNDHATIQTRGRIFSLYMITNYTAAGLGQFLLPLADPAAFYLFVVVSLIYSVSLIPILLTQHKAPLPATSEMINLRALYRVSPVGVVGSMVAGFINSSFYSMGPTFAHANGLSITSTSIFMASVILSGLLLQWPVGKLSDHIDRRYVLVGIALATFLSSITIALLSNHQIYILFITASIYGAVSLVCYSISAAHTNDFADKTRAAQTAGGLLIAYGIGAICGPFISSQAMQLIGPSGLFYNSALISILFMLFAISRIFVRPASSSSEKTEFIPIPSTQTASEELYLATIEEQQENSS